MKRLKFLILIFWVALSIPLAYFVLRTYRGLEQEEVATLSYFADTFFDEIEQALTSIVKLEEGRAIDEYNYHIFPSNQFQDSTGKSRSPLSRLPRDEYILGYFQNNPDGSFQTPMVVGDKPIPLEHKSLVAKLKHANSIFNRKRVTRTDRIMTQPAKVVADTDEKRQTGFAEKYLDLSRSRQPKIYLGQKEKRVEKITPMQALNIAKREQRETTKSSEPAAVAKTRSSSGLIAGDRAVIKSKAGKRSGLRKSFPTESEDYLLPAPASDGMETEGFQVEVAPLQSVFISADQIFIFRRIMINQKIYRQGFILRVRAFLSHLAQQYFVTQPMAGFANLRLRVIDQGNEIDRIEAGVSTRNSKFVLSRIFPSPFEFLNATLTSDQIPPAAGRNTLNVMVIVLAVIFLIGLFAIYQSARTIVDLSERRSQFVSSVTHELKTPLTNIRMYIEMLEQGIAQDHEREQEYFRIIDSESARLSRLINNVLDLSKLEKKQRQIDLKTGTFEEVIHEVEEVMQEKFRQEGFTLKVGQKNIRPFQYDREVMIQVLINLIENSMKFGKTSAKKEITVRLGRDGDWMKIYVSDIGPGIPHQALKKVFDEFYRVDSRLTKTTRGTGIGLALVKKFVNLMGGTVTAVNNDGAGCTITISLPLSAG